MESTESIHCLLPKHCPVQTTRRASAPFGPCCSRLRRAGADCKWDAFPSTPTHPRAEEEVAWHRRRHALPGVWHCAVSVRQDTYPGTAPHQCYVVSYAWDTLHGHALVIRNQTFFTTRHVSFLFPRTSFIVHQTRLLCFTTFFGVTFTVFSLGSPHTPHFPPFPLISPHFPPISPHFSEGLAPFGYIPGCFKGLHSVATTQHTLWHRIALLPQDARNDTALHHCHDYGRDHGTCPNETLHVEVNL